MQLQMTQCNTASSISLVDVSCCTVLIMMCYPAHYKIKSVIMCAVAIFF